jgi:hypothetical protein
MKTQQLFSIGIVLLLLSLLPLTVAAQQHTQDIFLPNGYGTKKIFGILPRTTGDSITLFMILPFLRTITIDGAYFNGHKGLFLIYGEYNWYPDGPPAIHP